MAESYGEQLRRRDEAAANQQRVTAEEARATQVDELLAHVADLQVTVDELAADKAKPKAKAR